MLAFKHDMAEAGEKVLHLFSAFITWRNKKQRFKILHSLLGGMYPLLFVFLFLHTSIKIFMLTVGGETAHRISMWNGR